MYLRTTKQRHKKFTAMKEMHNEHLAIQLSELGAELHSIKGTKSGNEYLWQGDAAYWNRQSPTLFPLVGGLWEGTYRLNGQARHMEKHGFVREMTFCETTQEEGTVRLTCTDNEQTRLCYPFAFRLDASYKLTGNIVHVEWEVHNPNNTPMPFHIGGHPGFYYPNFDPGIPLCGYLSFDRQEPESAAVGKGGCLGCKRYKLQMENGLFPLTDECFNNDAIILDREQVKQITLYDKQKNPVVTVDTESPVTLIWSPYGIHAPFVCIEPWYGLCDAENYTGDFTERPYTNIAPAGGSWKGGYSLTFPQE